MPIDFAFSRRRIIKQIKRGAGDDPHADRCPRRPDRRTCADGRAPPDGHSRGLRGDGRDVGHAEIAYTQELRKTGSEPGERPPEINCTAIKAALAYQRGAVSGLKRYATRGRFGP